MIVSNVTVGRARETANVTALTTTAVAAATRVASPVLEDCLGRKAEKNLLPLQPGDVPDTYADVDDLVRDVDYKPETSVEDGVARFVDWYMDYYGIDK